MLCRYKRALKRHWMQGNAVPAPLIIEIQRSHTSNFIKKNVQRPTTTCLGTSDAPL